MCLNTEVENLSSGRCALLKVVLDGLDFLQSYCSRSRRQILWFNTTFLSRTRFPCPRVVEPQHKQQLWGCERLEVWDSLWGCGTCRESWGHQAVASEPGEVIWKREARTLLTRLNPYLSWLECTLGSPGRRLESSAAGVKQTESCASPRSQRSTGNANATVSVKISTSKKKKKIHKPRQALTIFCGNSSNSLFATVSLTIQVVMGDDTESSGHFGVIDISSIGPVLLDVDCFLHFFMYFFYSVSWCDYNIRSWPN